MISNNRLIDFKNSSHSTQKFMVIALSCFFLTSIQSASARTGLHNTMNPTSETIHLQGDITVTFCSLGLLSSACKQSEPKWKSIDILMSNSQDGSSSVGASEFSIQAGAYKYLAQIQINKSLKNEITDYRLYINLYTLEISTGTYIYRGDMILHSESPQKLNSVSFSPATIDATGGFFIPRIYLTPVR